MNVFWLTLIGGLAYAFYARGQDAFQEIVDVTDAFTQYDELFRRFGAVNNVPWRWLKAIAMNESSLGQNPLVKAGLVSTDGLSYGLMQVTLSTAKWLNGNREVAPDELNDPEISVRLAAQYFNWLYNRYGGDRRKIVMSYNQGPGNTDKGNEYAADYYDRFVRNLNRVLDKQPGDEMERS